MDFQNRNANDNIGPIKGERYLPGEHPFASRHNLFHLLVGIEIYKADLFRVEVNEPVIAVMGEHFCCLAPVDRRAFGNDYLRGDG